MAPGFLAACDGRFNRVKVPWGKERVDSLELR